MFMRASELSMGDKFILEYNGQKYKHCGDYFAKGFTQTRIKVKAIGHQISPTIGRDMTKISIAKNAIVTLI